MPGKILYLYSEKREETLKKERKLFKMRGNFLEKERKPRGVRVSLRLSLRKREESVLASDLASVLASDLASELQL